MKKFLALTTVAVGLFGGSSNAIAQGTMGPPDNRQFTNLFHLALLDRVEGKTSWIYISPNENRGYRIRNRVPELLFFYGVRAAESDPKESQMVWARTHYEPIQPGVRLFRTINRSWDLTPKERDNFIRFFPKESTDIPTRKVRQWLDGSFLGINVRLEDWVNSISVSMGDEFKNVGTDRLLRVNARRANNEISWIPITTAVMSPAELHIWCAYSGRVASGRQLHHFHVIVVE